MPTLNANATLPKSCTAQEALDLFDRLEVVSLDFMLGRWKGDDIATGHPMDGLLKTTGWYGKEFVSPDCVHPLLFSDSKGDVFKVAPNPQMMKLAVNLSIPQNGLVTSASSMLTSLLKTEDPQARLRMMEHRGKLSATMIYDHLPIHDVFRKVNENTVLGLMDYKETPQPFFFVLERV